MRNKAGKTLALFLAAIWIIQVCAFASEQPWPGNEAVAAYGLEIISETKQESGILDMLGNPDSIASTITDQNAQSLTNDIPDIADLQGVEPAKGDLISLDSVGISIRASGYAVIEERDEFVYVETDPDYLYPYVIIGRYDFISESILDEYSAFMRKSYPDLDIRLMQEAYEINGDYFDKVVYTYMVGENEILDTRLFYELNGATYMFGSKESSGLNLNLPNNYLDGIADSFRLLSENPSDYPLHVNPELSITGPGSGMPKEDKRDPIPGPGPEKEPPEEEEIGDIFFDESTAAFEGTWVDFPDGFRLYLPSWWMSEPFSEEQIQDGYLFLAYDPNSQGAGPFVQIDWNSNEDGYDLNNIASILEDNGAEVEGKVRINGILCVVFAKPESDFEGIVFLHPQTNQILFQIAVYPFQEYFDMFSSILSSLSLA